MQDKYAIELERAIANWHFSKQHIPIEPIFDAIQIGIAHDMQVLVPIEEPESLLHAKEGSLNVGDVMTLTEDIRLHLRHHVVDEQGSYYLPVFTSNEKMMEAGPASSINYSFKAIASKLATRSKCLGIVINAGTNELVLTRETLDIVLKHDPRSRISFIRASVLDVQAGAIVNAANKSLLGGGGVDGAIHAAAGPALIAECRTLNGCETGSAKISASHRLKNADCIVHAVGPVYHGREKDAELLASCYRTSLDLALERGCASIAFPCISTGIYGYPLEEASLVSTKTVVRWLQEHPDIVMSVYFCCFREIEYHAYENIWDDIPHLA